MLGLALQHLLLPHLLGGVLAVALLLRNIFLALRKFIEFLQRIVDLLRLLLGGRCRPRLRLILILLGIEFQVEQAGEIAGRTTTSAAASSTLRSERNLNLPERRFCAQQILQSFLFARNRVLPFQLL